MTEEVSNEVLPAIMLDSLEYTSQTVRELEKRTHKSVKEALGDDSLDNLILLVQKGLKNCDENTALKAIDEWRASGKDTFELLVYIVETLENQGFLPKALKLTDKIKKRIEKVANMEDIEVLQNNG